MSEGELFGEIAFFAEVPQLEGVRAATVVRILTIPHAAYNGQKHHAQLKFCVL